jgi:hypothetical protein
VGVSDWRERCDDLSLRTWALLIVLGGFALMEMCRTSELKARVAALEATQKVEVGK